MIASKFGKFYGESCLVEVDLGIFIRDEKLAHDNNILKMIDLDLMRDLFYNDFHSRCDINKGLHDFWRIALNLKIS